MSTQKQKLFVKGSTAILIDVRRFGGGGPNTCGDFYSGGEVRYYCKDADTEVVESWKPGGDPDSGNLPSVPEAPPPDFWEPTLPEPGAPPDPTAPTVPAPKADLFIAVWHRWDCCCGRNIVSCDGAYQIESSGDEDNVRGTISDPCPADEG